MANKLQKMIGWVGTLAPVASFVVFIATAHADSSNGIPVLNNTSDVVGVLANVLDAMFYVLISVSVIMFLWAAYMYVMGGDDPKNISEAKMAIFYAVIGVVIALLAKSTPCILGSVLGATVPGCSGVVNSTIH